MKDNRYKLEQLYIVNKKIGDVDEAFLCVNVIDNFKEIFTNAYIEINDDDVIEPLSNRFNSERCLNDKNPYSLKYWLSVYKNINFCNDANNVAVDDVNIGALSDAEVFNHWHNLVLLKKYKLNDLYIVENSKRDIYICRYSAIFQKFIDIFTGEKFDPASLSFSFESYLIENSINCEYKKLNIYSLLRLYHEIIKIEYLDNYKPKKSKFEKQLCKIKPNKID